MFLIYVLFLIGIPVDMFPPRAAPRGRVCDRRVTDLPRRGKSGVTAPASRAHRPAVAHAAHAQVRMSYDSAAAPSS